MCFSGHSLFLNVDTSGIGLARVELQSSDGTPMPGFALDDCDRIHASNSTRYRVSWRRGSTDVSALAGRPVRLRVELQYGTRLYAFRFGEL